ncbi:hypothetical protein BDD12DRAFT_884318 [Trichophaea hybrida]|nr:hypothetical protein BDD12DRAFT_884318 [Trichophaea hybrida]
MNAHLAIQISIFTLATLVHTGRIYLDIVARRGIASRASLLWAIVGFACYVVVFSLEMWRYKHEKVLEVLAAQRMLAPAGLWTLKASVASLYPLLGVRRAVVRIAIAYLVASFVALGLVQLLMCRPWVAGSSGYCNRAPEVVVCTSLNLSGYILVMSIPLACWRYLSHKHAIVSMQLLAGGLCAISITHSILTLGLINHPKPLLPEILINPELSLALITASLPSLWTALSRGARHDGPYSAPDISKQPPDTPTDTRDLVGLSERFDPQHLGVLPDSIPGSLRSEVSTPRPVQEDWQAASMDTWRSFASGYSRDVVAPPCVELWEMDLERRGPESDEKDEGHCE